MKFTSILSLPIIVYILREISIGLVFSSGKNLHFKPLSYIEHYRNIQLKAPFMSCKNLGTNTYVITLISFEV